MRLQVALLWYSLPTSALGHYTDGHYKVQWILTSIKLISVAILYQESLKQKRNQFSPNLISEVNIFKKIITVNSIYYLSNEQISC